MRRSKVVFKTYRQTSTNHDWRHWDGSWMLRCGPHERGLLGNERGGVHPNPSFSSIISRFGTFDLYERQWVARPGTNMVLNYQRHDFSMLSIFFLFQILMFSTFLSFQVSNLKNTLNKTEHRGITTLEAVFEGSSYNTSMKMKFRKYTGDIMSQFLLVKKKVNSIEREASEVLNVTQTVKKTKEYEFYRWELRWSVI